MIYRTKGISTEQLAVCVELCKGRNLHVSDEVREGGITASTKHAFYSPEGKRIGQNVHFGIGSNDGNSSEITDLSFPELLAKMAEGWESSITTFELNDRYNAFINYTSKTVEVGCQTFPFAIIDELHKRMHSRD